MSTPLTSEPHVIVTYTSITQSLKHRSSLWGDLKIHWRPCDIKKNRLTINPVQYRCNASLFVTP